MKWYIPDESFLDKLRGHEKRIPKTDYGKNHMKPFFGILFERDGLVYITQISHPQQRHIKTKENIDFKKIYKNDKLIGVVNLNYMFPIYKNKLEEVKYANIEKYRKFKNDDEKNKYIALLKTELKIIKNKNIKEAAIKLYNHKIEFPDSIISNRCLDFVELERTCKNI